MRIVAPAFELDDIPGLALTNMEQLPQLDCINPLRVESAHLSDLLPSQLGLPVLRSIPISSIPDSIELILGVGSPVKIIKSVNCTSFGTMAAEGIRQGWGSNESEKHESAKLSAAGLSIEVEEDLFPSALPYSGMHTMKFRGVNPIGMATGSGTPHCGIDGYEVTGVSWDWVQDNFHEPESITGSL